MVIRAYLHKYWKIQKEGDIFQERVSSTHEEMFRTVLTH